MSSGSGSLPSDIEDLSDALRQLSLAQARVDRVLRRLRSRSSLLVAIPVSTLPVARVSPLRPRPQPSLADFSIGDRVRINRPNHNQQGSGVVLGFTSAGFLQMRTPNQELVLRKPHNVTLIVSTISVVQP